MPLDVRVGVELDGTRATVVTLDDSTVAEVRTVTGLDAADALAQAVAGARRGDPVRVVVLTDGAVLCRVDVTTQALSFDGFADLAYERTGAPREGTTAAGMFLDVSGIASGLLGSGVAAVSPADPAHEVYDQLRDRHPVEVVPSPFTAGTLEGVSLALRHTSAELTLVVDGLPVGSEQLPVGGLARVAAVLGGGGSVGQERLEAALAGQAVMDPIASGELERYLRTAFRQARDVLDGWALRGERVSREVYLFGPGSRARSATILLEDAGLLPHEHSDISRALVHLPPAERREVVGAYLAAITCGTDVPFAVFPDPHRVAQLREVERRRRRWWRWGTFAAAAGLLTAGAFGPAAVGAAARAAASDDLRAARAELAARGPAGTAAMELSGLHRAAEHIPAAQPWAPLLATLDRARVPGIELTATSAAATSDGQTLTVTGSSADGPNGVAAYAAALQHLMGAPVATTRLAEDARGQAGFTLTAELGRSR